MSAGRLKRVGLEEVIHHSPFLVLSFSPMSADKFLQEEEGLRRVY